LDYDNGAQIAMSAGGTGIIAFILLILKKCTPCGRTASPIEQAAPCPEDTVYQYCESLIFGGPALTAEVAASYATVIGLILAGVILLVGFLARLGKEGERRG